MKERKFFCVSGLFISFFIVALSGQDLTSKMLFSKREKTCLGWGAGGVTFNLFIILRKAGKGAERNRKGGEGRGGKGREKGERSATPKFINLESLSLEIQNPMVLASSFV